MKPYKKNYLSEEWFDLDNLIILIPALIFLIVPGIIALIFWGLLKMTDYIIYNSPWNKRLMKKFEDSVKKEEYRLGLKGRTKKDVYYDPHFIDNNSYQTREEYLEELKKMKYHSQPQYLRVEGTLKGIFCNYDCLYDIHQQIEKPNSFLAIRKDKISEYNTVEKKYTPKAYSRQ